MIKVVAINTSINKGGAALTASSIGGTNKGNNNYKQDLLSPEGFISQGVLPAKILHRQNNFSFWYVLNVAVYRIFGIEGFFNRKWWVERIPMIIDSADIIHLHNIHGYYLPWEIVETILRFRPVVITLHDYHLVTGGIASPKHGTRFLFRLFHRPYPYEIIDRSRLRRKIYHSAIIRYKPLLVAPSHAMVNEIRQLGFPDIDIHVIPNGIFPECTLDLKSFNKKPFSIMFVSDRLSNPIKGFDVFVEALSRVRGIECEVYIVGDDVPNDVSDTRFHFLGRLSHPQVLDAMSRCSVYVSCSLSETFGRTLIEAIGLGLRVVCTDLPIFRETIGDDARYFEVGDVDGLSTIIRHESEFDADERFLFKRASEYQKKFSIDSMSNAYGLLYESLVP